MRQFSPKHSLSRILSTVVHESPGVIVTFDEPTALPIMPAETTSEMTEQQISNDEDLPKQSNLHNNGFLEIHKEPLSIPPNNELTNGLKRPLSVDPLDSDKIKKIRFSENGGEDQQKDTILNNENDNIDLLIKKLDQIAGSIENTIDDKKPNVSNETKNVINESNNLINLVNCDDENGIDDKDKEVSLDKETISKDIGKEEESKTNSTNNIINNSEFIGHSEENIKNDKNELVDKDEICNKTISDMNRSSSSDNLVIVENLDHENIAVIDSPVTENISSVVHDIIVTESNLNNTSTTISKVNNIVNPKQIDTKLVLESNVEIVKKITNEIPTIKTQTTESHPDNTNTEIDLCSDDNDQDFELIDSDSDIPDNIKVFLKTVDLKTREGYKQFIKLFDNHTLFFGTFETLFLKKVNEYMTQKSYNGEHRSEIQLLQEREKYWRSKFASLTKQISELKSIVKVHAADLKIDKNASPHLITRTVGLQAVLCQSKGDSMQLPKLAIPSPKPNNNSVNISDDEDDDVSIVEVNSAKPSTSKTSDKTTPKKQLSSSCIASQSPVLSSKVIPVALPSNPFNNDSNTIDLTGNDDVTEESEIIDLEEEPISYSVLHRQSPGKLPAQLSGNLPNHFAYLGVPNNQTSSSSFIVRTSTSGSSQQTTVLNRDTIIQSDPKSKNLKPFIISDVSRVDPVLVQPCTVAYTTQRVVPVSQISGSLQPISTVPYTRQLPVSGLPVSSPHVSHGTSFTTRHLSVSGVPISLSQTSPVTSFTTCRLPISLHAISTPSIENGLMRSQPARSLQRPPPLAIPIPEHPARVPEIPNQRSLTSWKRLPPAPRVSLSRSIDRQPRNYPQALVLSWDMTLNKTMAEIVSYQVYGYQEVSSIPPTVDLWKIIGEVNALTLPMACSLTHFTSGEKYHFTVRAVDVYTRVGPFSAPQSVFLD